MYFINNLSMKDVFVNTCIKYAGQFFLCNSSKSCWSTTNVVSRQMDTTIYLPLIHRN